MPEKVHLDPELEDMRHERTKVTTKTKLARQLLIPREMALLLLSSAQPAVSRWTQARQKSYHLVPDLNQ